MTLLPPILNLLFTDILFLSGIYLFFRKKTNIKKITFGVFLLASVLSLLSVPVFMMRKHWEVYLLSLKQSFWYDICIIQTDNSFWEEAAKLSVLLFTCRLVKIKSLFENNISKNVVSLGYWIGLCYGIGEAIMLALLMLYPGYAHYFGLNTFGLFLKQWFIYDRFWVIQIHAVIGGIIGIGVSNYLVTNRVLKPVIYFFSAMVYHILIDGTLTGAAYYPQIIKYFPPNYLFLPLITAAGYLNLFIAFKTSRHLNKISVKY